MKRKWFFRVVLILCILFFISGQSHSQQYSPQFQSLLHQVQQIYLSPRGESLMNLRNNYPTILATLIGHALRQQIVFVQQNPSLNNPFMNLQREAQAFIAEVARTTPARVQDGSPFTPQGLWYLANNAMQGTEDGFVLQTYGVRIGTMPLVMTADSGPQQAPPAYIAPSPGPQQTPSVAVTPPSGPQQPSPPMAAPPFVRESSQPSPQGNSIDLVGRQAPAVRGAPPTKTPSPPPQAQRRLNPDGVQGIWLTYFQEKVSGQLKIWKEGDTYLGMIIQGGTFAGWKRNEVAFRVKYTGQEGQYLVFKGKSNDRIGNPYDKRYEWKAYTAGYWATNEGKEKFGCYWSGIPDRFERGR